MTILYKPVLIETVEQAEALPPGTIACDPEADSRVGIRMPGSDRFGWSCSFDHDPTAYSSSVVGWTALVPVEAEEEWALIYDDEEQAIYAVEADVRKWARIDGEGQAPSRRYTTAWEEAQ